MYLRLSLEDKKDSGREFCDDGWSGTGMNQLLAEVKKSRIQCIIVKDMSRFSRDYIEMGTYLNQIFPFMGVRFIVLGDHYDSREDLIGTEIPGLKIPTDGNTFEVRSANTDTKTGYRLIRRL